MGHFTYQLLYLSQMFFKHQKIVVCQIVASLGTRVIIFQGRAEKKSEVF